MVPFDLHVLGTPPAFILSQDQTLMLKYGLQILLRKIKRNFVSLLWQILYCLFDLAPVKLAFL